MFYILKKAEIKNHFGYFELCLKWDQVEMAQDKLIDNQLILKNKYSEKYLDLFEAALLKEKNGFVKIFLENRVDLVKFLTVERLNSLYHQDNVDN